MKAWRRSGGLGSGIACPTPFDIIADNEGSSVVAVQWGLDPDDDTGEIQFEVSFNGGGWNAADPSDCSSALHLQNFDLTGHEGDDAQFRLRFVGACTSEWVVSNVVVVV